MNKSISTFLAFLSLVGQLLGRYIKVGDPAEINGLNYIDFYIRSYPIIVGGESRAITFFEGHADLLNSLIRKRLTKGGVMPGELRGIPPQNWVKFSDENGQTFALFSYKSLHRCSASAMPGSEIVDMINLMELRTSYQNDPKFYMSRSAFATQRKIHTTTTEASEMYIVDHHFSNLTSLPGAHSDIRVIPFATDQCYFKNDPVLKHAKWILTGAVNTFRWEERQFLAVFDKNFNKLKSWILLENDPARDSKRAEKNWLPFWDKCKLMFSVPEYDFF